MDGLKYIINFDLNHDDAKTKFYNWLSRRKFKPMNCTKDIIIKKVSPCYIPCHLCDFTVYGKYSALHSKTYTISENDIVNVDSNKKNITRYATKRINDRVIENYKYSFKNYPMYLSRNINKNKIAKIGDFNFNNLLFNYDESFKAPKEEFNKELAECFRDYREQIESNIITKIDKESGSTFGEAALNFENNFLSGIHLTCINFTDVYCKNVLLPIWFCKYDYKGKHYWCLINGQTGKTVGTFPHSVVAILTIIAIFGLIVFLIIFKLWEPVT